jgi:hypothetical protein
MKTADELTDEELLSRYVREDSGEGEHGEIFLAILHRYRNSVRREMEAAGLAAAESERRVGTVFVRALDPPEGPPAGVDLRELALSVARHVAADSKWASF